MHARRMKQTKKHLVVTLKAVAHHVGLTPGTVSAVLNNSVASQSFPQRTKDRVLAAARELNYRPNFFARTLRMKRTYTIGVITEEIGDPYGSTVIGGVEKYLRQHGFFFLTVAHRHDPKLLESYSHLLLERGVEGFITVDTSITQPPPLPTVAVAGHRRVKGVTNIVLDHQTAALMALKHLTQFGHKEIAFMKGPTSSSDSEDRWKSIIQVCRRLNIQVKPELTLRVEGNAASPDLGYPYAKLLISRNTGFTALFAYNDNLAIGAIRAIHEAGLRVPEDVSVVGFDDIQGAAYCNPALTTVRQPLEKMGEIAARSLLDRIENPKTYVPEIAIEPEFVVRKSTARPRAEVMQAYKAAVRLVSRR
ncbi:MAG TPA: LacI family DNA-binding transcriptional regulator [Candidatus Acidoferrales bacterium]|nr:LacI family DNA-binding transcriptional regulator [Candidatus Acidoferrales bacterium]